MEANTVGTWSEIGYNAPGTKDNSASAHTNNFGYSDAVTTNKATWTATASVKLNDCPIGGKWIAEAESESNSSEGTTYVKVTAPATGSTDDCTGLTPSFANLARATAQ
ncbi:MAG: hypothetical protein IJ905_10910 [Fibrobacter sp.]|nr:hypothetical protein [Fibrobacter sp.]